MNIEVRNLGFSYGENEVLKDISFSVKSGEFISVLGPNGTGKSTLFRCLLKWISPQSGSVHLDGRDIRTLNDAQMAQCMAYIPQSHNPIFNYSVEDMVLMGMTSQLGRFSCPSALQRKKANSILRRLGIGCLARRGYLNISGGERQLVLIARAIAQEAMIFVMDEPSSGLDFGNRIHVMETMKSLTKQGYTVIQSTHDPDQAYLYSDRIIALHNGGILFSGPPEEVFTDKNLSELYGMNIKVHRLQDGKIRICLPANLK